MSNRDSGGGPGVRGHNRGSTVARNYADVLLSLARKAEDTAGWGNMLRQVADAIEADNTLRLFLASPRIGVDVKQQVLSKALTDSVPRLFLRFLQSLVQNRRQALIPAISDEYDSLLDEAEGRVFARVTIAREATDAEKTEIGARLSRTLGKTVAAHVVTDPSIVGGIIVRIGDTVMDGSIKRKLAMLRRTMVAGKMK